MGRRRNNSCPRLDEENPGRSDPLLAWFTPRSSAVLRSLQRSIHRLLVSPDEAAVPGPIDRISSLAAFFYVALFLVTRTRLRSATTSNPTWIKGAIPITKRARPSKETLYEAFRKAQGSLSTFLGMGSPVPLAPEADACVMHGSSTSLNLPSDSVDVIITSPPYCTRIDYVASVRPELAILGYGDREAKLLRHLSLGNPTVPRESRLPGKVDSKTARTFLADVLSHPSKASETYYLRYFDTYFRMLGNSLNELRRVAKQGAAAFVVAQDSYYKEVRLDLPRVLTEMARERGWKLNRQFDFPVDRTMAAINPLARKHRDSFRAIESVLLMTKA